MPHHSLAGVLVVIGTIGVSLAGSQKSGFVAKAFKHADGTTTFYVVFVPHNYHAATKPVPVILYWGGSAEYKGGSVRPGEGGIAQAIRQREKRFPFLTILPQPEGSTANNIRRFSAILDSVMKQYRTDPDRVYLTGLSSGGIGAWAMAAARPDRWAAIVPICGSGNPKIAATIKHIPCWCFHGDRDDVINVSGSRQMITALKAAGATPKYTEYRGVGHNSWDRAYGDDALYAWLLKQRRNRR